MSVLHPRPGPHPVHLVHRIGAGALGAFLVVFAVVGIAQGTPLMSTVGTPVMGLTSNGLLSAISLLVGLVLVVSAARGGPMASTVSIVVGAGFLVSGLGNALVLGTPMNMLAFGLPNVVFSLAAGTVLLVLGSYGRVSGGLPAGSPYRADTAAEAPPLTVEQHEERIGSRGSAEELAAAERADALHHATPEQHRRLDQVNAHRAHDDRRRAWEASERLDPPL